MAQLSLYIDDPTMASLRQRAAKKNMSLSKYVRERLSKMPDDDEGSWPDSFWTTFGALSDPTFEAPAELEWANDAPRLSFD